LLRPRQYHLILRNPVDPQKGLLLMSSSNRESLIAIARGIIEDLEARDPVLLVALTDVNTYSAIFSDPALISALSQAAQQSDSSSIQHLLSGFTGSSSSNSSFVGPNTHDADSVHPSEEHGDCPICYELLGPGDAAMRCAGEGGVHHYFHATCLQQWIRNCRNRHQATCPVCRGHLQFNGQRLQEYLQSGASQTLNEDERTFFQAIADGLQGKNSWSQMTTLEKSAYASGILAAAGWGFMLGYTEPHHHATNVLAVQHSQHEHQLAQGLGWLVGLIVRIIRNRYEERDRDRRRH
jgi:hypothetical protein